MKRKKKKSKLRALMGKYVASKKKKLPKGYDSAFEVELDKSLGSAWMHHPPRINYTSTHTYQPDFIKVEVDKTTYIEAKGRFRTRNEASKYIAIREHLPKGTELVFIFYDASKPMCGAQKRKDGTKQSHGEWAKSNNFRFYCRKEGYTDVI